jgi:nicotinamidase-related amidase
MKAALIVVDMLTDFFERSAELAAERSRLVANTNTLVRAFRSRRLPVFWVRQEFAPDLHDAFLDMRANNVSITIAGTAGCEVLPELERSPNDIVIVKKRYSAFFGTSLETQLAQLGPELVVVTGVNTHACVRMTAIDAYQRDYAVIVAADAVGSRDPEHHEVTLRYLDGHIARVLPSAEVVRVLDAREGVNAT